MADDQGFSVVRHFAPEDEVHGVASDVMLS
jgi:hypothetical protein